MALVVKSLWYYIVLFESCQYYYDKKCIKNLYMYFVVNIHIKIYQTRVGNGLDRSAKVSSYPFSHLRFFTLFRMIQRVFCSVEQSSTLQSPLGSSWASRRISTWNLLQTCDSSPKTKNDLLLTQNGGMLSSRHTKTLILLSVCYRWQAS